MSGKDDVTVLLEKLLSGTDSASGSEDGDEANSGGEAEGSPTGDLFGDIDPELLLRLFDIASKMGGNDKNTALLMALRPHLREENRVKLDRAAKIMKLISIIPLLRDSGIADDLFR